MVLSAIFINWKLGIILWHNRQVQSLPTVMILPPGQHLFSERQFRPAALFAIMLRNKLNGTTKKLPTIFLRGSHQPEIVDVQDAELQELRLLKH